MKQQLRKSTVASVSRTYYEVSVCLPMFESAIPLVPALGTPKRVTVERCVPKEGHANEVSTLIGVATSNTTADYT